MGHKTKLIERLNDIGKSLKTHQDGLGLIGLGSVGVELARLDDYSDLDFFAIVAPGTKFKFINNLNWLSQLCPIAYCFRNSFDGYKLLFEDGVFCEFAVFEPQELNNIPFAKGRFVWADESLSDDLVIPRRALPNLNHSLDFILGELITNLYVGLGRFRRGEKTSALRFIQSYAVDRVIDLFNLQQTETPAYGDAFCPDRRVESRFPDYQTMLPTFMQGYEQSPESALAILEFVQQHYELNPIMVNEVKNLAQH